MPNFTWVLPSGSAVTTGASPRVGSGMELLPSASVSELVDPGTSEAWPPGSDAAPDCSNAGGEAGAGASGVGVAVGVGVAAGLGVAAFGVGVVAASGAVDDGVT